MSPEKLAFGAIILGLSFGFFGNLAANFIWWNFDEIKSKKHKWFIKYFFGSFCLIIFLVLLLYLEYVFSNIK